MRCTHTRHCTHRCLCTACTHCVHMACRHALYMQLHGVRACCLLPALHVCWCCWGAGGALQPQRCVCACVLLHACVQCSRKAPCKAPALGPAAGAACYSQGAVQCVGPDPELVLWCLHGPGASLVTPPVCTSRGPARPSHAASLSLPAPALRQLPLKAVTKASLLPGQSRYKTPSSCRHPGLSCACRAGDTHPSTPHPAGPSDAAGMEPGTPTAAPELPFLRFLKREEDAAQRGGSMGGGVPVQTLRPPCTAAHTVQNEQPGAAANSWASCESRGSQVSGGAMAHVTGGAMG